MKQVRAAERVRLIRTFVNNDPMKSQRRGGAPWVAWAIGHHCSHLEGRWRRGGAPSSYRRICPPFMQPLWQSNGWEAFRGAVHRQRHLRHVATEVPEPYPTSFLPKGSCERKDLQTWTPKPPRAKSRGHGVCEGGDSSGVPQSSRRSAA